MSPPAEAFVTLPRGLRVAVTAAPGLEPLDAVVRAIGRDTITLGMLDLPEDAATLVGVRVGIAAQVHGRRYELDATVRAIEAAPPGLVVSMPTEARRSQRRSFYRLNVSIEARGHWVEGAAAEDDADAEELDLPRHSLDSARLLDISGGGSLVRTRQPVPIGALVTLWFTLEAGTPPVEIRARVKAVRLEERTHAYRLNTEFEGIARRTQEQIVRFIFQQQTLLSRRRSA
ncbi:MAG: PilZ domain-containing protein [Dehalococcoidia bacterium]|nr:PilZ domain-containing protein [Dehalococcoidia bacterium]